MHFKIHSRGGCIALGILSIGPDSLSGNSGTGLETRESINGSQPVFSILRLHTTSLPGNFDDDPSTRATTKLNDDNGRTRRPPWMIV
jgi:hypothetical protein